MQRQLKASLYYLSTDAKYNLTYFWSILISVLLLTIIVDVIFSGDGVISFNFSFAIYIFVAIMGYVTIKNTIPYIIKMGSTRKNIFLAMGIYFIGIATLNALLANTIQFIVTLFYKLFGNRTVLNKAMFTVSDGTESINFNHIAFFIQDTWLTRVIIDIAISLFLISVMYFIGLIFYRFGVVGGLLFLGGLMLTFIFGMSEGWLLNLIIIIFKDFSILFFYQLVLIALVVYLLSYLILRRLPIS